jgi:hypothetical protein
MAASDLDGRCCIQLNYGTNPSISRRDAADEGPRALRNTRADPLGLFGERDDLRAMRPQARGVHVAEDDERVVRAVRASRVLARNREDLGHQRRVVRIER